MVKGAGAITLLNGPRLADQTSAARQLPRQRSRGRDIPGFIDRDEYEQAVDRVLACWCCRCGNPREIGQLALNVVEQTITRNSSNPTATAINPLISVLLVSLIGVWGR